MTSQAWFRDGRPGRVRPFLLAITFIGATLLLVHPSTGQESSSPDDQHVETRLDDALDTVEQGLREGQTDKEVSRSVFESILDFFHDAAMGMFDAIANAIAGDDDTITYDEFRNVVSSMTLYQAMSIAEEYGLATEEMAGASIGAIKLIVNFDDGTIADMVFENGVLVTTSKESKE